MSDRIVSDALHELRVLAAELRADALESRGAYLEPARVLAAASRIERAGRRDPAGRRAGRRRGSVAPGDARGGCWRARASWSWTTIPTCAT